MMPEVKLIYVDFEFSEETRNVISTETTDWDIVSDEEYKLLQKWVEHKNSKYIKVPYSYPSYGYILVERCHKALPELVKEALEIVRKEEAELFEKKMKREEKIKKATATKKANEMKKKKEMYEKLKRELNV